MPAIPKYINDCTPPGTAIGYEALKMPIVYETLSQIIQLAETTPNDQDLGRELRRLVNKYKEEND